MCISGIFVYPVMQLFPVPCFPVVDFPCLQGIDEVFNKMVTLLRKAELQRRVSGTRSRTTTGERKVHNLQGSLFQSLVKSETRRDAESLV